MIVTMKKYKLGVLLSAVLVFILPLISFAADFPKPTSEFFVNDYANVMSREDKDTIMQIGADLYKQTSAQIVVVTVNSLNGYNVKDYALKLGREWGVGDKEKNNGVVLLLSVSDRQVTIQVGYGLEGCLPDGKTGRILDNCAIPYLSENNFSKGLTEAYKAISDSVYKEYNVEPGVAYEIDGNVDEDTLEDIIGYIIIIVIVILLTLLKGRRRRFFFFPFIGGGHSGFGGFSGGSRGSGGFSGGGGSFGGGGSSRGF